MVIIIKMAALIRCVFRKSHNLGHNFSANIFVHECMKVQKTVPLISSARCIADMPEKKKYLLIDIHKRIDRNLGISTELFNSLLSSLEEHGPVTEDDIALLLHICSFGPFDSSSSNRLQYAEQIWNRLDELSVQPTAKLYNMKLKAYCSNDKSFTPLDELANMKSSGINPDKITYGYLIERFCRSGDISGANHVLEAMNNAQIFIGISVFNSFITGHLKAGSPEQASNVLETLRSRSLSPNPDTFYRFIQHYAEEGDVESAMKYIHEAEKEGMPLDQIRLLDVYRLMLRSGQAGQAKQILTLLMEKDVFRVTAMQNLCQLVAEGYQNEALKLYLDIPKPLKSEIPVTSGSFLLKSMIVNNQNAKDIVNIADGLLEAVPSTTPHIYTLLYAYRMDKHDIAVQVLEEMMARHQDVKIPMVLPALCYYKNAKDVEGVYKMVDMILNLDHCEETLEVLSNFCHPMLNQLGQSDEDIVNNMKDHEAKWNTLFWLKGLQNDCVAALEAVEDKPLDPRLLSSLAINTNMLVKYLPEQSEACVQLVTKLIKHYKLSRMVAVNLLFNRLKANDMDTANFMLDSFLKEKIKFPDIVLRYRKTQEVPEKIRVKLQKLCEVKQHFQPHPSRVKNMEQLKEMSREELEAYIDQTPNQVIARVATLNKAMAEKDLPEIQKRLKEIKDYEFLFPKFQLNDVIWSLSELGDAETAYLYFLELQERFGNSYKDIMALSLALKLMDTGNINGALEMIEEAKKSELQNQQGREYLRRTKVASLLKAAKTSDEAESIHEALVKGGDYLTGEDARQAHFHYIRRVLDKDDDKDLLERLVQLRDQYWVFPCMDRVIERFIKKQDVESLKRVMDLGVSVVGNNLFHHKLACGFISNSMPSQAEAIFKNLNDKLNCRLLETSCDYYIKNKQVEHVESLVDLVKGLPVSRATMLKKLIEAHVSTNNLTKAAEVLQTFDNEFLIPHKSSLDLLKSSFKKHNTEQPEILIAFLSKRETLDEVKPHDSESSSSSSESESSDSSDSDTEVPQEKSKSLQQESSVESTDTKTP